jgi:hypothetical protein
MRTTLASLLFTLTAAACGVDTDIPPPSDGYTSLISGGWTLDAGDEKYICVRLTVTQDSYVQSLRPVAPPGTHHTVLMIGARDGEDGVTECTSALTKPAIYASGVGTQALDLPAGTAVHVRSGQQLLLNLHLFNASDAPITGTSGIDVLTVEPGDVQREAGVVLIGKAQGLAIPPNASTQTGRCTTPSGASVIAIAPHMHMLGRHMKVSYADANSGGVRMLHDLPYSFDEQRFALISPEQVTSAGGRITVECSYFNHTGQTVYFGESSTEEMCYALAFVSPPPRAEQCLQ